MITDTPLFNNGVYIDALTIVTLIWLNERAMRVGK